MASHRKLLEPPVFLATIQTNRLCEKCQQINILLALPRALLHHNYRALKTSASRGCSICQFLYNEIIIRPGTHLVIPPGQTAQTQLLIENDSDTQNITVVDFSATAHRFELYRKQDIVPSMLLQIDISYRRIYPHPETEGCWNLIEQWLKTCVSSHQACKQPEERISPTRLLDVSSDRPKLVITDATEKYKRYVALSHCWGSGRTIHTSRSSLQSLMDGIDMFYLPPTFRDAVKITRQLGIAYLWIDSLCIIQDSVNDWERESAMMGYVYKDCFLNISALGAHNSSHGMLNPRPDSSEVLIRDDFCLRRARPSWGDIFQTSPLSQRAWVLQERLISTRVLHFGDQEIFWECSTCSIRESDEKEHTAHSDTFGWSDENFKRSLLLAESPISSTMSSPQIREKAILTRWYQIITATGYTYLAGIWKEDIHTGLLWYKDHYCEASNGYIAPSWSWAAIPGPICMLNSSLINEANEEDFRVSRLPDSTLLTAEILDTSVTLDSPDKFGTIKAGHIKMNCVTKQVWYKSSEGEPPYNDPFLELILDIFDETGRPLGTGYLDISNSNISTFGHCKAIVITEKVQKLGNRTVSVVYFLLVESTSVALTHYKRIGIGFTADALFGEVIDHGAFNEQEREEIYLI